MTDVTDPVIATTEPLAAPEGLARRRWRTLLHNPVGVVALVFLLIVTVVAIFAPLIAPDNPLHQDLLSIFKGPSGAPSPRHRRPRARRAQPADLRHPGVLGGRSHLRRRLPGHCRPHRLCGRLPGRLDRPAGADPRRCPAVGSASDPRLRHRRGARTERHQPDHLSGRVLRARCSCA